MHRAGWRIAGLAALLLVGCAGAEPRRDFDRLHASITGAPDRLQIERDDPSIEIRPDFLAHAEESVRRLEAVFGPLDRPLVVKIGRQSTTLRIAYDPAEDAISMPGGGGVVDHGLEAWDCLDHELFHAMVGRKFPALVTPEALASSEVAAIHEGTADYFAWLRDDDPDFGENYHSSGRPMRKYREGFRYALVSGSHARGSAVARYLIDEEIPLSAIALFFAHGDIRPEKLVDPADHAAFGLLPERAPAVTATLEGHEPSRLNRYRLRGSTTLTLAPNEAYTAQFGTLDVRFTTDTGAPPEHFTLRTGGTTTFTVEPRDDEGEKLVASLHAGGERIGFLVFYLSVTRD